MIHPVCLSLAITNKCPLQCRHCGPSSGPDQTGNLGQDVIDKILTEASSLEITIVNFSGGEPFTQRNILIDSVRKAKVLGLRTRITTGGYWANSAKAAEGVLAPLHQAGLAELFFSVSDAHLEFLKINNVLNGVNAARKFNIDVYLVVAHSSSPILNIGDLIKEFENAGIPIPFIQNSPIIPFGRAESNYKDDINLIDDELILEPCLSIMRHPTIYSDGSVAACGVIFGMTNQTLHFGNVNNEPLGMILERMNNSPFANWISHFGFAKLKQLLIKEGGIELGAKHANICHLCGEILSNQKAIEYLKKNKFIHE